jgi:hypothetical protein
MTTFDEVLVESSVAFMKKAKADGKPFFLWHHTVARLVVPVRALQEHDEPGNQLRARRSWNGAA